LDEKEEGEGKNTAGEYVREKKNRESDPTKFMKEV